MPKLHNFPRTEVGHLNMLSGSFAATVTKTFNCLAGLYQVCVAFSTDSVSKASTVQVFPYADEDQSAVGTAFDLVGGGAGGTVDGTVTIGTGTNAEVEWTLTDVFIPFGAKVTFSTTSATGSGTIDVFFRNEG